MGTFQIKSPTVYAAVNVASYWQLLAKYLTQHGAASPPKCHAFYVTNTIIYGYEIIMALAGVARQIVVVLLLGCAAERHGMTVAAQGEHLVALSRYNGARDASHWLVIQIHY